MNMAAAGTSKEKPAETGHYVDHIALDDVNEADRNPKAHDEAGINRSIGRFGLAELPLMDDRTGKLIAGHGRLEQLRQMRADGQAPPAGVRVAADGTWLMPVIRGWASRSDDEAAAYLIASNRLTERGGWDTYELTEMLAELAEGQLLELTGYDQSELAAMEALLRGPELGDGSDDDVLNATDRAAWPVIRAQVPPEIHQRWNLIEGNDDAARVRTVLDLAGI
jgi:hypothetical protein